MITTDDLRSWVSLLERGESEELSRVMSQRLLDEERAELREAERRERETTPTPECHGCGKCRASAASR